jgi:membrane protein implicated in regulation of membrane protease activity
LVARDLDGNRSIVKLGLGMKLVYIFIAAYCIFLGQFPWFFISLAIVDVLILYFLIRYLRESVHATLAS